MTKVTYFEDLLSSFFGTTTKQKKEQFAVHIDVPGNSKKVKQFIDTIKSFKNLKLETEPELKFNFFGYPYLQEKPTIDIKDYMKKGTWVLFGCQLVDDEWDVEVAIKEQLPVYVSSSVKTYSLNDDAWAIVEKLRKYTKANYPKKDKKKSNGYPEIEKVVVSTDPRAFDCTCTVNNLSNDIRVFDSVVKIGTQRFVIEKDYDSKYITVGNQKLLL